MKNAPVCASTHAAYDIQRRYVRPRAKTRTRQFWTRARSAVITGNLMLITIMYSQLRHIRYHRKNCILYNFNAPSSIYGTIPRGWKKMCCYRLRRILIRYCRVCGVIETGSYFKIFTFNRPAGNYFKFKL